MVGKAITGVDSSVVIPTDPTFNQLATSIGQISTGKKWAAGTTASNSSGRITVTGLKFKPSFVISKYKPGGGQEYYAIGVLSSPLMSAINITQGSTYRKNANFISRSDGFSIDHYDTQVDTYDWIAFE